MTDDPVGLVARAIKRSLTGEECFRVEGEYTNMARAAIAAMREPTETMLKAAQERKGQQSYTDIWHDMIDAALKEAADAQ